MASNASFDAQLVDQVVDITNFTDRAVISSALKANHGEVNSVLMEYFDGPDKVGQPLDSRVEPRPIRADLVTVQAQVWLG